MRGVRNGLYIDLEIRRRLNFLIVILEVRFYFFKFREEILVCLEFCF